VQIVFKKVQILLGIFACISVIVLAAPSDDTPSDKDNAKVEAAPDPKAQPDLSQDDQDPDLVKAVMDALDAVKKEAPDVHDQALKVWKKFDGTTNPNFTYRFWGRRLILWLKDNKKVTFDGQKKVADVFLVLWRQGKISKSAAITLSIDAWGHLVFLQGAPGLGSRLEENREPGGGESAPGDVNKKRPKAEISL
jgi:hypothetical protein